MNICMIPARKGSERLTKKNYLKIDRFTVLEIALNKAIKSKAFDRIYINSDDPNLEEVALRLGVNFYLRDEKLASSQATSDQVVLDFFNNIECNRLFWLNTVSPLQTIGDIKNFVSLSQDSIWKSSVSVNTSSVHSVYKDNPFRLVSGEIEDDNHELVISSCSKVSPDFDLLKPFLKDFDF